MWTCLHCGESVEENFAVCWNCQADGEGNPPKGDASPLQAVAEENRAAVVGPSGPRRCLRCDKLLDYAGKKHFMDDWGGGALGKFLFDLYLGDDEGLEMYVCPGCRHVEFFAAESGEPAGTPETGA